MRIGRRYRFSASHRLDRMPHGHKCRRLHGHNYMVEVTVQADELDEALMVMDFAAVDTMVTPLIDQLDHHHLNDVMELDQPTAEAIGQWIYEGITPHIDREVFLVNVVVWETENCWAEWP